MAEEEGTSNIDAGAVRASENLRSAGYKDLGVEPLGVDTYTIGELVERIGPPESPVCAVYVDWGDFGTSIFVLTLTAAKKVVERFTSEGKGPEGMAKPEGKNTYAPWMPSEEGERFLGSIASYMSKGYMAGLSSNYSELPEEPKWVSVAVDMLAALLSIPVASIDEDCFTIVYRNKLVRHDDGSGGLDVTGRLIMIDPSISCAQDQQ